jgi:hypothetical protein
MAFRRALAFQAAQGVKVTSAMIKEAEWISGLELTDAERDDTARSLQRSLASFEALRKVEVGYDIPPALAFVPTIAAPIIEPVRRNRASALESNAPKRPESDEDLAFLPVTRCSSAS